MSYLDYHSCLKVLCTPSFISCYSMNQCLVCGFAVAVDTPSPDTRSSYLLWNLFLQANSNWEHLYFLKQWIKRRQSSLLKSTPFFEGNSVASPESQVIAVPQHYCGFARLVCQDGSTALPVSIYLARYSLGKNCCQDSMPCADFKLAAFQNGDQKLCRF